RSCACINRPSDLPCIRQSPSRLGTVVTRQLSSKLERSKPIGSAVPTSRTRPPPCRERRPAFSIGLQPAEPPAPVRHPPTSLDRLTFSSPSHSIGWGLVPTS